MESTGMWVVCACMCTHACMMGGSRESAVGEYCGKSVRASRNISASDPSPSPATSLTTHAARAREQQRGLGWASPGLETGAARPAVAFRREQPLRFCSHTLHARLQLLSMKRLFLEHSPILAHVAHSGFLSAHSPTTSSTTWRGPHR
jgi:hypothetical protein